MHRTTAPYALLLAALLGLSQCKKKDPDPAAGLPAATQEGRNTFGCLVDGQVWTPSGNDGTSNFRLTYDPGPAGADLAIRAYRYVGDSKLQSFRIGGAPVPGAGTYALSQNGPCGVNYLDATALGTCKEFRYATNGYYCAGILRVTRLDLNAGIIAGTFEAKVAQLGCDTLRITQGRFDYKL